MLPSTIMLPNLGLKHHHLLHKLLQELLTGPPVSALAPCTILFQPSSPLAWTITVLQPFTLAPNTQPVLHTIVFKSF